MGDGSKHIKSHILAVRTKIQYIYGIDFGTNRYVRLDISNGQLIEHTLDTI